ncbi:hypothetical protein KUTeg_012851 [Tegillarca granosa]|uniref:Monocarboxylate transporter 12 n=1 Tax=Tegillarca granosa TaxID=220873 RepID=A0ABQ9EWK7_TEGGR|nr:hypothetical protein KUTeg_012851 [Tegillarca granosa]
MVAPRAETTPLSKENVNEDRAASTSSRNSVPIGPDGGYGWVIVGCSFICIFTIDGIITTYALLLPELNQSFQTTPALTSMGNSLILGIFLLMAACGFVASSMSSGIWTFLPTFGVIGGIGIGMVYLPSVLMVNSYFNQKRGIAQGIVTSGSGVGILVLAPLMEVLLENYGWRGAVLISAGLVLQLCVCSLLMRPLYIHTKSSVTRNVDKLPVASDNSLKLSTFDSDFKNKSYIEHYLKTSSNYNSTPTINTNNKHTLTQTNPKTPEQYLSMQCIKTAQYTVKTEREFKPLSKKDIFYSGSVQKLKEFDSHSTITEFEKRMTNRMYSSSDVSCKSDNIRSCSTEGLCDRSLLTNKAFLLLAAGAMLTQMGQYIPMVFLGDYALQIGLDRADVSIILAVFGQNLFYFM